MKVSFFLTQPVYPPYGNGAGKARSPAKGDAGKLPALREVSGAIRTNEIVTALRYGAR